MTRGEFLGGVAVLLATGAGGSWLYATQVEPHWLQIVSRSLPVAGLPESLAGAKVVHLSDLHVGPLVSDDYILETFRRIEAIGPDILVVTGDFASSLTNNVSHAARIYERMPHGRLATLGVLGNHDYGHAWANERAADRLVDALDGSGIRVLRNEIATVSGLQVVGLDDLWARHFDPATAFAKLDTGQAMLALSHNPDTVDLDVWERFGGWILSGHTHGGQCRPPFLPPPLLPVQNRRYTAGEFDLTGRRRIYISRGVGHLTQARFLVRPEVTAFSLERL